MNDNLNKSKDNSSRLNNVLVFLFFLGLIFIIIGNLSGESIDDYFGYILLSGVSLVVGICIFLNDNLNDLSGGFEKLFKDIFDGFFEILIKPFLPVIELLICLIGIIVLKGFVDSFVNGYG